MKGPLRRSLSETKEYNPGYENESVATVHITDHLLTRPLRKFESLIPIC